jgi:hypothetical protein
VKSTKKLPVCRCLQSGSNNVTAFVFVNIISMAYEFTSTPVNTIVSLVCKVTSSPVVGSTSILASVTAGRLRYYLNSLKIVKPSIDGQIST